MDFYIVIPAYNEELYLKNMLQSLVDQTLLPKKIMIVNDNSTDDSQAIIDNFTSNYNFISSVLNNSEAGHQPGSKVVSAFYKGLEALDTDYDLIGKFDADIILPANYFERMIEIFKSDKNIGIAGGNLYLKENDELVYENISERTKVRGPIKLYRKACFLEIGGLKQAIGWDTADELLALYHGWKISTDPELKVIHLKPTGASYSKNSRYKQGEAFYRMRYGLLLSNIAAAKLAYQKSSFLLYTDSLKGYLKARRNKIPFVVSEEEGSFIRRLRWKNIKNKIF
jgi:glycosyltransferase involved in cell wall biosynthesis